MIGDPIELQLMGLIPTLRGDRLDMKERKRSYANKYTSDAEQSTHNR